VAFQGVFAAQALRMIGNNLKINQVNGTEVILAITHDHP
jgi:hypothetical protein